MVTVGTVKNGYFRFFWVLLNPATVKVPQGRTWLHHVHPTWWRARVLGGKPFFLLFFSWNSFFVVEGHIFGGKLRLKRKRLGSFIRCFWVAELGSCCWFWLLVKLLGSCCWFWLLVKLLGSCCWFWFLVKLLHNCCWIRTLGELLLVETLTDFLVGSVWYSVKLCVNTLFEFIVVYRRCWPSLVGRGPNRAPVVTGPVWCS